MTTPVSTTARKPAATLPAGAARMSKTWVDAAGLPHVTTYAVPVDANDRKTPHVRFRCRGHIEVTVEGGPATKQPCDVDRWVLPGEKPGFCADHGCELTRGNEGGDTTTALPLKALWRQVEPSARPLYALAAVAAAGAGLDGGDLPVGLPLAVTPALAWGGYRVVRRHLTRRAIRSGRIDEGQTTGRAVDTIERRARFAAYCSAAAGAWLTAAAAVDPASLPGKVVWASLPAWWAICAAPWWKRVEARRSEVKSDPGNATAAAVTPELTEDQKAAIEAARMWTADAAIPNSALDATTWTRIPCGWQAVVRATKRGALNQLGDDNMKATTKKVAALFDVSRSAITWIEEHDGNPNQALLLVQPNNPLKAGQLWPGPESIRITDRTIEYDSGQLIDGGPIVDKLYVFGWGAPGEVALGTTGGGKSMRARKRLVVERWASSVDPATGQRKGLFLSFLHDPKRLESYGEFRDAVHGYGMTRDDAHIMVDAFTRECMRRYDMLREIVWYDVRNGKQRKRRGGVKWNPMVHGPILSAHWDEFHALAGDQEFVKKLETLGRYIRAGALRNAIYSHMATIGDTGSQALRDMVAGGRSTLFRTTSGLNAALTTGGQLTADPRALPKDPGMCLVADGETATLMGRESWIPGSDEEAQAAGADRTLYDWLFDDDNQPIGFPAEIPAETAEAFGPEFMEWMAAGRSERGRDGWVYKAAPVPVPADDRLATDGLLRILLEEGRPMTRKEVGDHPGWRWSVTQTMTNAINAGLKANPAWLLRAQDGKRVTFDLTPAAREQAAAVAEESREEVCEG